MNMIQTSFGKLEYRLEGSGKKVALLLYGGHTNAGTRLGEDYFLERGYSVLAVSRPGYGQTPLSTGPTPDTFADALSEMLQELGISKVLVVGVSAGGRTAIRFAARHADMTDKLILQSSISFAPYPGLLARLGTYIGFNGLTEKYTWKLLHYVLKRNPGSFLGMMIGSLTTLDANKIVGAFSKKQLQELTTLFANMSSGRGFLNDIKTVDNDATDVTAPTLIIHSKYDGNVSLVHPRLLAEQIKGSRLYLSEAESHLLWFSPHYTGIKHVMDDFLQASRKNEYNYLPEGLPAPKDDGACKHLLGKELASIGLRATGGQLIDLSKASSRYVVIFCYPMTGSPTNRVLWDYADEWNAIPGACGCTPQACGYRDTLAQFKDLDASVFGLSTNAPDYQKEAADRLELEYDLLSDENMDFARSLELPAFEFHDLRLLKRVTLIVHDHKIVKVLYPVFPSNTDAERVLAWLRKH